MTILSSNYNLFFNREGLVVGYNIRKGTFALITEKVFKFLDKNDVNQIEDAKSLIDLGFLCIENEIHTITRKYEAVKNIDILYLTLIPTLSCNFSCNYCFQHGYRNNKIWNRETGDHLVKFIKFMIRNKNKRKIHCTWFGGEPLLELNSVIENSLRIRNIVEKENAELTGIDIVTNGILLDEYAAISLRDCGVKSAQVSIDTWEFRKPSNRGLVDSTGNHSVIISNAKKASEYMNIRVRINIGEGIASKLDETILFLERENLNYGFGRVDNYDEGCSGCIEDEWKQTNSTIQRNEYSDIELRAVYNSKYFLNMIQEKLTPKSSPCGAMTGNMFVIDNAGYISRCWASAGKPYEADGHISSFHSLFSEQSQSKWMNYNPLDCKECRECKVLPLCMGGCAYSRLFRGGKKLSCEAVKNQVEMFAREIAEHVQIPSEG